MVGRLLAIYLWLDFVACVSTHTGESARTLLAPSPQEEEAAGAILPEAGESWFLGERNEKESKSGLERFAQPPFFQSCRSSPRGTAVEYNDVALSSMQSQQYPKDPRAARSKKQLLRSTRRQNRSTKSQTHGQCFRTSCHGFPLRRPAEFSEKWKQEFLWTSPLGCHRGQFCHQRLLSKHRWRLQRRRTRCCNISEGYSQWTWSSRSRWHQDWRSFP